MDKISILPLGKILIGERVFDPKIVHNDPVSNEDIVQKNEQMLLTMLTNKQKELEVKLKDPSQVAYRDFNLVCFNDGSEVYTTDYNDLVDGIEFLKKKDYIPFLQICSSFIIRICLREGIALDNKLINVLFEFLFFKIV